MRAFFWGLGIVVLCAVVRAETTPQAPFRARTVYPYAGPSQPPQVGTFSDDVFKLPEDNDSNPPPPEYMNGRPLADPSQLYRGQEEEFRNNPDCLKMKQAGDMAGYSNCVQDLRDKKISDVRKRLNQNSKDANRPLRRTNSAAPLIDEAPNAGNEEND